MSHVLEIRRRLAMMQRLVQDRMKKVQGTQKRLHDVHSSTRSLQVGDKELVLLSTPGSKLEVHWQGPFKVTKVFNDGLHYGIDTGKSHKQHRVYHINLLSKWQSRDETASYIMSESFETSLPHEKCISPFGYERMGGCYHFGCLNQGPERSGEGPFTKIRRCLFW